MNDIQAALGSSQLKRINSIIKERNDILKKYKELFQEKNIFFLNIPENVQSSYI